MNEREMQDVMIYIFADHDTDIRPEKRKVWFDQFKHIDFEVGMTAARLIVARKSFGLPKVHDFACAVDEVLSGIGGAETWGEAWDKWVKTVQRFGYYRLPECLKVYESISPTGYRAMGTSAMEWFTLSVEDTATFKAQFRQRYELLAERAKAERITSPEVRQAIDATRAALSSDGEPAKVGDIAKKLIEKLPH